jgi:hypothetical protein
VRNTIKRFLYGLLLVISIIPAIVLMVAFPALIFVLCIVVIVYIAGAMIDEELEYRKADWRGPDPWST